MRAVVSGKNTIRLLNFRRIHDCSPLRPGRNVVVAAKAGTHLIGTGSSAGEVHTPPRKRRSIGLSPCSRVRKFLFATS